MDHYFNPVCGTPLWNPQSVYLPSPDFTFCFQYTLLIWTPCFLIWLGMPLWVHMLTKNTGHRINISWLLISKTVSITALIIIEIIELISAFNDQNFVVYFMTPLIFIATYVFVLAMTHYERVKGWRNSSFVFIFWFILALCESLTFRSKLIYTFFQNNSEAVIGYNRTPSDLKLFKLTDTSIGLFYLKYALTLLNLILYTRSEDYVDKVKGSPESTCSLMARLTFWWTNSLINIGFKRDLRREDLWTIDEKLKSEFVTNKLESEWNSSASEYIKRVQEMNKKMDQSRNDSYLYKPEDGEFLEPMVKVEGADKSSYKLETRTPSLGRALIMIVFGKFIGALALKICDDLLNFVRPILLDKLITFIMDKDQKLTVGIFFILILCAFSIAQTLILQHYYYNMFIIGQRLKLSLMNVVYKKSFRLSASARRKTTVGEMTNLLTTNATTFAHCTWHFVGIISAPFQITICTYLLYQKIGISTFIGMTTMLIFIPLNAYLAGFSKKLRREKYQLQDSRIRMMNEILSGIRVIRFHGWELSFQKIVQKLRKSEMDILIKSALLSTVTGLTWACVPFVVACVSFTGFLLMDKKNNLNPNTAFVSLTLFNMLRAPLNRLPYIIQGLVQLNVSLTRIRDFLLLDEIIDTDIRHDIQGGKLIKIDSVINIENVNFGWTKETETLKDINISISKGKLVAIVGSVGSGKSSLLSACLGEMHKLDEGLVNIQGPIAYVPQQAWIQNETVRNNILFNHPFNAQFYTECIAACSLLVDLDIMPAGDMTEIGEKGINLSGGQKQRVSLARSVYSDANIYLLDDPLSAVDSHVGKSIFDRVIGPNGLLKDKTRLFVTNSLSFLPETDSILFIEDGKIVQKGNYQELTSQIGPFTEFIKGFKQTIRIEKTVDMEVANNEMTEEPIKLFDVNSTKVGEKLIGKERVQGGHVKLGIVFDYLKACRLWLSGVFLLLRFLSYTSGVGSNFWLSDWSNDAQLEEGATSKYYRLAIYALLSFMDHFITFLTNLCFVGMFIRATTVLHDQLLYSTLRSNLRFFETTSIGTILNRFTKDIEATEDSIPYAVKSLIDCSMSLTSMVMMISTSTPLFLVALVPITAAYIGFRRYFVPSNRQIKRMESTTKSPIFAHFSETQSGVSTIKAYKVEQKFISQMKSNIDENLTCAYSNSVCNRWLALRLELLGNLITIFAATFAIYARNTLSAGLAGLSISTSLNISGTLNWFVQASSTFEVNITSIERIKEYLEIEPEAEWSIEATKPKSEWPQFGEITFENYGLKYRDNLDHVLKGIDVKIKAGEKIGIVGRTGAGKSSLTLGLFRMLEFSEGKIWIDGVDSSRLGLHDLRHKLTIIPQDPVIFSGTIRMNLDPFGIYTDRDLWLALELAHLKEFISGIENQLMFECSEGGENLSVGQRQLLCLARALLRKTRILVLDEATASVDYNTDDLIQKTIRSEFTESTVLTIAHRLNTIMDNSRIIVLDKGEIVEFDSPMNLLQNKQSRFYSIASEAGLV